MRTVPVRFGLMIAMSAVAAGQLVQPGPFGEPIAVRSVPVAGAAIQAGVWRRPASALSRVVAGMRAPRTESQAQPANPPHTPLGAFKVTAYSGPQRGGAYPITASGTRVRAGRTVAVDPKVIPLGTRLYIEGIGERIAEDTGGKVRGRHIDVYMPSVPHARRFGVQRAKVSRLAHPDDKG